MEGDPAALEELRALGVSLVPAVARDGRVVHGWNPRGYAALLGVSYEGPASLPPAELVRRLDGFLAHTQRLVAAIPEERLGWTPPQRDRTLRDLAYHIFRLSLAFADGMEHGEVPEGWLQEKTPAALGDGPAIAGYGALVRARLAGWVEGAKPGEYARIVRVYSGPQSGRELLERTTWHAAQHLRQLHALVQEVGVIPPADLPVIDFAGLPLPESLW